MEEQAHIASVSVAEELARKDQQLERLHQAYLDLQQQTHQLQQQRNQQQQQEQPSLMRDNVFKMVNHLPTFTGTGEVTINSFFSSIEYLLSTISDENLKKEAVRIIFYKVIQGQAKDVIINIPTPDNWNVIKETLKLRYRPNVEPHHLYKMIANLKVNSVSELVIEVQNIKYKSDELTVYYHNDHYIDLSNIDSLLVNTIKEMTQGTLLDKIYEERNINDILKILTKRRFENTCIRPEYRKFKTNDDRTFRQNRPQNKNTFNNQNNNNHQGYYQRNYVGQNYFRQNTGQARNNNDNYNNSGRFRIQNTRDNNPSGNFQRFGQVGHPRPNFNQNRWNQPRQNLNEPMDVDNIERYGIHNIQRVGQVGHPRPCFSQNRLEQPRQDLNAPMESRNDVQNYKSNEIIENSELKECKCDGGQFKQTPNNQREGYDQLAGHSEPEPCRSNVAQTRQSQDQFFFKTTSDFLPIINIKIRGKIYDALIDTGASISLIDSNVKDFRKNLLKEPIKFSTINKKDFIRYEVVTDAPDEFNIPHYAKIRWKVAELKGRRYKFIIGIDLLNCFKTMVNLEDGYISFNDKVTNFLINPYNDLEICALEAIEFYSELQNRIQLEHLNEEEKREILKILNRFQKLFFKEGDRLTSTMKIQHEIRTITEEKINSKLYRYPPQHETEVRKQVREMEAQGIIRKSFSRYASPLIIVPKKFDNSGEKKYRLVVDYRKLNEITIDDKFPLPNIDSILDKLGRAQYFTTLDLAKGYHQILVREQDREKTAFVTPHGLYEFVRMPFGLKNAPATFQRLMNETLREFINKTCVVYLDDILIFSTSLKEHIRAITEIFMALEKANLKIQIDKCNFLKKETEFLGHILTKDGLKPNPNKIKIIQEITLPKTEKQIKSFLGLTGYYRKFIKDYAKVAQPITKYLKKGVKVNVNDPTYVEAFEKLKLLISSHPILRYPDFEKMFTLTTDASNYAIGAVLSQEGHPVCFISRTLNNHERNYATTDKEFLAILWSVNYLRPYLYGRKFKILTDHQPIKFLHAKYKGKDMSPRHQRWILKLGEYDFTVEYIKGKENRVADFLSRLEHVNEENIQNNWDNESDCDRIDNVEDENVSMATIHSADENLHDHFYIKEEIVNKYKTQIILTNNKVEELQELHGKRIIYIAESDFEVMGQIFRKYITKGKVGIFSELSDRIYNIVQEKLIEMFSNDKQINFTKCTTRARDIETEVEAVKQISLYHVRESMHSGIIETYNQLKNKIYYPKLMEVIQLVINQCEICQEIKYDRKPIKPKFLVTETPSDKNEIVHIDTYVMKRNYFLTIIDKFSKFGAAYPLNDRNHVTLIEQLEDHFAKIGKPKKIVADNEFKAIRIKEFLEKENIELHHTKPNSHTGNADIERLHNTIAEKFRILYKLEKNIPIKQLIQKAIRSYNERYHSSIKCTPSDVHLGRIENGTVKRNLEENKRKIIEKLNRSREDYSENREEGFIKNYKAIRHKEQPKYKKSKLERVHHCNIKRPLKFTVMDNTDDTPMDTTD